MMAFKNLQIPKFTPNKTFSAARIPHAGLFVNVNPYGIEILTRAGVRVGASQSQI